MNIENDSMATIPDSNEVRSLKQGSSILSKSIETGDLSYVQEFLISENQFEELEKLSHKEKKNFLALLIEFLDQPLRVEAINVIYAIFNSVGDSSDYCKKLIERSNDFSKLVYLKGKIDFLKHMSKKKIKEIKPEAEFNE